MKTVKRHITSFEFWDFEIGIWYMCDGLSQSGFEYIVVRNGVLIDQSDKEYQTVPQAGIGALNVLEDYYAKKD